jgi:hypothetical protein
MEQIVSLLTLSSKFNICKCVRSKVASEGCNLPLERAVLLAGYFCLGKNSPKLLSVPPLHIVANHDDAGVMLILCNGQWPIMSSVIRA